MSLKIESTGCSDEKRILRGGVIVGFASRLTNGRWGACGTDGRRLTPAQFSTPVRVRNWFAERPTPDPE
jgi:hypothetical protein